MPYPLFRPATPPDAYLPADPTNTATLARLRSQQLRPPSPLYDRDSLISAEDGTHFSHSKEEIAEPLDAASFPVTASLSGTTVHKVSLRDRIAHFTWLWFISTMSTGGTAILLAETPHRFRGLYTIGVILFLFDLAVFTTLCLLMATRFAVAPRHTLRALLHPPEMFAFGAFLLSIAVLLGEIQVYAIRGQMGTRGPAWLWLIDAIHILYWIYAGCALFTASLQYFLFVWRRPSTPLPMQSSWFLSAFSVMLTGTVAALISETQPPARRLPIAVAGVLYQGFGWIFGFLLTVIFMQRLMEDGLPPPAKRPGLFIPIAVVGYTITALMGLARTLPRDYGYFASHPGAVDSLQAVALFVGIFLWLFGFWWFAFALLSCLVSIPHMGFSLSWWVAIFPNVGYTLATIQLGLQLESEAILWVTSVMAILLVVVLIATWATCMWSVITRRIMWPGKDEDKEL